MYEVSGEFRKIAVVIPCYRVRDRLRGVVESLPDWIDAIIVVDDGCPEKSYEVLSEGPADVRVALVRHESNQGVGGAMITGFRKALEGDYEIIVKIDGDGQMDPAHLADIVHPIASGLCDFAKGNRFIHLENLRAMPFARRMGNVGLTFLTKFASGQWHLSDPTNGYLAIHREALRLLSFKRLSQGYFFETSLLIQLNIIRAVAFDIPIPARYAGERSSLSITRALFGFPPRLLWGLMNRFLWRYCFYDVNATTFCLIIGGLMTIGGVSFGAYRWVEGSLTGQFQSAGTVALSLLPTIIGMQLLLQALVLDVVDMPRLPLSRLLGARRR
ncbi:MAG TPA: glycosyltransferase family 2 protein [Chthoniobacterales bacterium]|nr:glycosyltransferase family 2 protein [Chthoniobacterales bacterium]